jgi:hypothetical protein
MAYMEMNRRKFLAMAAMAPAVAATAKFLPKPTPAPVIESDLHWTEGRRQYDDGKYQVTVTKWESSRAFKPGDCITITCSHRDYNGTYQMGRDGVFHRVTNPCAKEITL